jgi:N-acetylmuramoyl-L-alanine amidase
MKNVFIILQILAFFYISYKICQYEKPIKEELLITEAPKPEVNYELEILAKIVAAEALGESFQGKLAVASVVLNRVEAKEFPNTIQEVIYQKNQFHGVSSPLFNRPNEDCYIAAKRALEGAIITEALFYANTDTATNRGWIKHIKKLYPNQEKIGNHTFYNKSI